MTVTITHSQTDGTIVEGTAKPMAPIIKGCGFRWSRNIGSGGAWYLQNSRFKPAKEYKINELATALRDAGHEVEVEVDNERLDVAEREELRAESLANRQAALENKAEKLATVADARLGQARQIMDMIPLGQPILVGHHSERRHRRDIERIDTNMRKGIEAQKEAEEAQRRADASRANQAHREDLGTTLRRIEKLEADLRGLERRIVGNACPVAGRKFKADAAVTIGEKKTCPYCRKEYEVTEDRTVSVHYVYDHDAPPTGSPLARYMEQKADLVAEIEHWKAHVAGLADTGVKVWGPSDFTKGDWVKTRFGWHEVVRVNKKSVTVKTQYSWTDTVGYDRVQGQRSPNSATPTEPNEGETRDEHSPA